MIRTAKSLSRLLLLPRDTQGVGSHAAHMLLRSGVGKLRLIDFDQASAGGYSLTRRALASLTAHALAQRLALTSASPLAQVTLSSLNRHAVATRADVGLPKATVLKRHFEGMMPDAEVEACVRMYEEARGQCTPHGHISGRITITRCSPSCPCGVCAAFGDRRHRLQIFPRP